MVSVFGWTGVEETNARGASTGNPWQTHAATLHAEWEPVRRSVITPDQPIITRLDPLNALSAPYVPQDRSRGLNRAPIPVERPKLWDVQIQLPRTDIQKKQPSFLCWDEITPIAVTSFKVGKQSRSDFNSSISSAQNPSGNRFCRWLCCCCSCCSEPDRSAAETQQRRSDAAVRKLSRKHPGKELQVAVAITMPCRPYRILPDWYFPNTDPILWYQWEAWPEEYAGLDFAIGVHTCRLKDEG